MDRLVVWLRQKIDGQEKQELMQNLAYKDDFEQKLRNLGWHEFQYKPPYGDKEVIKLRWQSPPNTDKNYTTRAFLDRFGDSTFRKILSSMFSSPRTKDELSIRYGGKKLDEHLNFMLEQEIIVKDGDLLRKSPQYEHINDIGKTLEWYVSEWFRLEQKVPARHGVHISDIADGGDLDVVAFPDLLYMFVETKSGDPSNITEKHLELFLRRAADFNSPIALLLIDTDADIAKQIEMLKKVYSEKHLKNPSTFNGAPCNPVQVHVKNTKKGIDRALLDTLRNHHTNDYSDRPLIGISNVTVQPKKSAEDHLKDMQRRIDLSRARENITSRHTIATWMERNGSGGYHYIHDVFPGESAEEAIHRNNCRLLVRKGLLKAEDDDGVTLGPFNFDSKKRYFATI